MHYPGFGFDATKYEAEFPSAVTSNGDDNSDSNYSITSRRICVPVFHGSIKLITRYTKEGDARIVSSFSDSEITARDPLPCWNTIPRINRKRAIDELDECLSDFVSPIVSSCKSDEDLYVPVHNNTQHYVPNQIIRNEQMQNSYSIPISQHDIVSPVYFENKENICFAIPGRSEMISAHIIGSESDEISQSSIPSWIDLASNDQRSVGNLITPFRHQETKEIKSKNIWAPSLTVVPNFNFQSPEPQKQFILNPRTGNFHNENVDYGNNNSDYAWGDYSQDEMSCENVSVQCSSNLGSLEPFHRLSGIVPSENDGGKPVKKSIHLIQDWLERKFHEYRILHYKRKYHRRVLVDKMKDHKLFSPCSWMTSSSQDGEDFEAELNNFLERV